MTRDVFERIVKDAHARRELLWLRAQEKDDVRTAGDLERIDPGLIRRLRVAGADLDGPPGERTSERRERFGRLQDECYARHAAMLSR